ncbi:MAG: helix-turn-helix transcriptional regulator [Clostridia bacterium]|nr:helix-turn-helix transcriptional regulator [Clostridia bacterium]
MTLGQAFTIRFNELLKKDGRSLYKFLKDNCIPRSTIVNILEGNTKSPGLALIYQVANAFGITHLEFLDVPIFKSEDIDYI